MDRNTSIDNLTQGVFKSLSARRAWIEIRCMQCFLFFFYVALRKESVDRNNVEKFLMYCSVMSLSARRAWIEMGQSIRNILTLTASLSARRAWIEMRTRSQPSKPRRVALRKESVDRNLGAMQIIIVEMKSLSARRAWIEISMRMYHTT